MVLSERQANLFEFVKGQHGDQKRKYTNEPYWNHLYAVAEIVSEHEPEGVEIALCHDLFEDTKCTPLKLMAFMMENGYSKKEAERTWTGVHELTDVYVPETFPELNRGYRKTLEAKRLWRISPLAQSVKYADLIDNTSSIVEYDKGFAKKYLSEKTVILDGMKSGNKDLFDKCCQVLTAALNQLT